MKHSANHHYDHLSAIRLFISSTFADMQQERDCFNDVLVTKLRALCRDRGVSFFSVDLRWGVTDEDIANERLIPRCLSEVDKCRPFFLGIIGGRYGSQMKSVPQELLREYPWLAEKAGASYTELEITYHFLKDRTGENSLFLFKECDFDGDDADLQAMQNLKTYIQKMAPDRIRTYRTLEEFQNIILQEFEQWLVEMYGQTDIHLERELLFARENDSHIVKNTDEEKSVYNCIRQTSAATMLYGKGPLGKTAIVNDVAKRFAHQIVINCHADEANVYWPYVVYSIYKKIVALHVLAPGQAEWFRENEQRFSHMPLLSMQEEEQLKTEFLQLLSKIKWKKTILAINDIEYISGKQNKYLQWLPSEPPKGLEIVCSTNDEDILNSAKIMGWNLVELRPMEKYTAHTVLKQELDKLGKSADDARALLESPLAGYPGYLKTSIDVLNAFGSYDTVTSLSENLAAAADFTQFYDVVFQQIASRYGTSSANDLRLVLGALHLSALPLSEDGRYHVLHKIRKREKAQWSAVSDVLKSLRLVDLSGGLSGVLRDYIGQTISPEEKESIHKALGQYWHSVANTPQGADLSCLIAALQHYTDSKQVDAILTVLSDAQRVKDLCLYGSDGLRRALAAVMLHSERNVSKLLVGWMAELVHTTPDGDMRVSCVIKQLYDFYGELGLEKEQKRRDQLFEQAVVKDLLAPDDMLGPLILDAEWTNAEKTAASDLEAAVARLDQLIGDPNTLPEHKARYGIFKAELKYRARRGDVLEDIQEALQMSLQAAALDSILDAYDLKITVLNWIRKYDEAYALADSAEQWSRDLGYLSVTLAFVQQKIVYWYRTKKFDLALAESKKYHELCIRWGNTNNAAVMMQNIANVYNLSEDYDNCIQYTKNCLKDRKLPSKYRITLLNVQKAAYYNTKQYEKARQTVKEAMAEPALAEHQRIILSLSQAFLWMEKGEKHYPKALTEMEQAFAILQERNNLEPIQYCLQNAFPMLIATKEGKAFWNRWKEQLGQEAMICRRATDSMDLLQNGAFFTATQGMPTVSKNVKKLTEAYRIAIERKDHIRAAESAYDLGMIYGQTDPGEGAAYYLHSAEAFGAAGLPEKEQDAALAALQLLIREGTVSDQQQYLLARTHLDGKAAALVENWVTAGAMLQDFEKQDEVLQILKSVASAGKDNAQTILAVFVDLSTQITRYLPTVHIQELTELAVANGISDTVFMRLFYSALEENFMLSKSIFSETQIAALEEKDGDLATVIAASPYFTIMGGRDHGQTSTGTKKPKVQYAVQPKYTCKKLDHVFATVARLSDDKLLCITDVVFRSMTKELRAAVKQYVADATPEVSWNLALQPNDCVKCIAIVRTENSSGLKAAYREHTKFLMGVIKDLDALAEKLSNE